MDAPFFSTFSAVSELFVTASVFYIIISNYKRNPFAWKFATAVIIFEFSVNMLYMIIRMQAVPGESGEGSPYALAAAFHGSMSLLMFIVLVVYTFLATSAQKRGEFYFAERPKLTFGLLALWTISVTTGEGLYIFNYLL